MKVLVLGKLEGTYPLAEYIADEGHAVYYFQQVVDSTRRVWIEDGRTLMHVAAWRPLIEDMDFIVADSPYFSSKASAIPAGVPTIGFAPGLDVIYSQRGNIFFDESVNTYRDFVARSHTIWGLFGRDKWLYTTARHEAAQKILLALTDLLTKIEYIGPIQARYAKRGKAIYLLDLSPHFGYGVLIDICKEFDLSVMQVLRDLQEGTLTGLPTAPKRGWRFWRRVR